MAKKKVKKRDFSKVKEKALKILKISAKVLIAIIGIAITVAFIVVPFLHNQINDFVAKCIWYPSCLINCLLLISNIVYVYLAHSYTTYGQSICFYRNFFVLIPSVL